MLKKLPLKAMIALLILVGLAASGFMAQRQISAGWNRVQDAQRMQPLAEIVDAAAALVTEIQKERGASAVYLTTGGTSFREELDAQRLAADAALAVFQQRIARSDQLIAGESFFAQLQHVTLLLDGLSGQRENIDNLRLATGEAVAAYSALTAAMIGLTFEVSAESSDSQLLTALEFKASMQQIIDVAGLERAIGSAGFETSTFEPARLARLTSLVATQSAVGVFAERLANADETERLAALETSPSFQRVNVLREAYFGGNQELIAETSGADWFALTTDRIGGLLEVEAMATERAFARIAQLEDTAVSAIWADVRVLAASLVVSLLISFAVYRTIMGSFRQSISAIEGVVAGDLDVEVPEETPNIFGQLSRAVQALKDSLQAKVVLEQQAAEAERHQAAVVETLGKSLERVAQGELNFQITEPFPEEFEALRTDFNRSVAQLDRGLSDVDRSAASVMRQASEMSQVAMGLSQRTEEQAAALTQTALSLNDMTEHLASASAAAIKTQNMTSDTSDKVEKSGAIVRSAVKTMTEVQSSAAEIASIVNLIDDLSFQTNLLALNAGVEAARAGEAGRGFAVVASEVRALAARSAASANEIRGLIEASDERVQTGVRLVGETGEALEEIVISVGKISEQMHHIATASTSQSQGMSEINEGMKQIEHVTLTNNETADQAAQAGEALTNEARQMQSVMRGFSIGSAAQEAEAA